MPLRFLRPGIRQSERWNACDFFAQSFYVRLLTVVDDYGRYEANPRLLRSELFPLGSPDGSDLHLQTVADGLLTLANKCLLTLYVYEGKQYLQLTNWKEKHRSTSRYPSPDDEKSTHCEHLLADVNKCVQLQTPPPPPPPPSTPSSSPTPKYTASAVAEVSLDHQAKIADKPKTKPSEPSSSDQRRLTDLWMAEYAAAHDGEKYLFQGARDGQAASRLLKLGLSPEAIIDVAKAAWERTKSNPESFNCKQAAELSRFAATFNAIRDELRNKSNGKRNSRIDGINVDIADVSRRTAAEVARRRAAYMSNHTTAANPVPSAGPAEQPRLEVPVSGEVAQTTDPHRGA